MPSHVLSNRWAQLGLAATAVAAVLVAPLATNTTAKADAVTIAGARSLSDQVSVQFEPEDRKTMDVHLLAYNDFAVTAMLLSQDNQTMVPTRTSTCRKVSKEMLEAAAAAGW